MASPAKEEDEENAQQPPPPPPPLATMVPPMEAREELQPPFSFVKLLLSPDDRERISASTVEEQENLQEGGSVAEDAVDGLLRLILEGDPVVEGAKGGGEVGDEGPSTGKSAKLNRDQRMNRKLLRKLQVKPMTGVLKVTMLGTKENKRYQISFSKPDVFELPRSEGFAIIGEGSEEVVSDSGPEAQAAQQGLKMRDIDITDLHESDVVPTVTHEDVYDGGDKCVDDTKDDTQRGIEPGDVSIVMEHAAVPSVDGCESTQAPRG